MRHFWVSLAFLGCYVAALALPACFEDLSTSSAPGKTEKTLNIRFPSNNVVLGVDALAFGWSGQGIIPECANIALALGWLVFLANRFKIAAGLGIIALILGATAPYMFEVPFRLLGPGFYLWMLSHSALVVGAALCARGDTYHGGGPDRVDSAPS